jgi:4-amino-4-deoxy-L-arabinose transferase-like glycosyltransferase
MIQIYLQISKFVGCWHIPIKKLSLHPMLESLKKRWELLFTLCLFITLKIPALRYPFFSDESWSYAPAVKLMYRHGASLMPNAIDVAASRGHPLLFYALAATWMKIFGASHSAQHAFSLFISVLLMISVYEVCRKLFDKRTAVISLILLPLQVMFSVQSTLLLPEVMVALLALLTLYFYCKEKYLRTFLWCTALIFTKESGMVMGLVLGLHATYKLLNKEELLRLRLKRFLSIFLPGILIGIFYLLQKKLNGWYLFPEHIGMITADWAIFWKKFRYCCEVLFYLDYRFRLFQVLMMLAIIVAVYLKDIRYTIPLVPAYLIYACVEDRFSWLPRPLLLLATLLSLIYCIYRLIDFSALKNPDTVKKKAARKFIFLSVVFVSAYLIFSCINFFTARYMVCALVFVLILAAAYLSVYVSKLYDPVYQVTIVCLLLAGYYGYKYDNGVLDINRGTFAAMEVQENIVSYFEKEHLYSKNIYASFLNREHLKKPLTGFLHTDSVFTSVSYEVQPNSDYLIFDNIDSSELYTSYKNNAAYHLVYKTSKGPAWEEVYERVK